MKIVEIEQLIWWEDWIELEEINVDYFRQKFKTKSKTFSGKSCLIDDRNKYLK